MGDIPKKTSVSWSKDMSRLCGIGLHSSTSMSGEHACSRSPQRLPRGSRKWLQEALLCLGFRIIELYKVTFSATVPRAGSSAGGRSVGVEYARTTLSIGEATGNGVLPGDDEGGGALPAVDGSRGAVLG